MSRIPFREYLGPSRAKFTRALAKFRAVVQGNPQDPVIAKSHQSGSFKETG